MQQVLIMMQGKKKRRKLTKKRPRRKKHQSKKAGVNIEDEIARLKNEINIVKGSIESEEQARNYEDSKFWNLDNRINSLINQELAFLIDENGVRREEFTQEVKDLLKKKEEAKFAYKKKENEISRLMKIKNKLILELIIIT